jgi:hypothetical protein
MLPLSNIPTECLCRCERDNLMSALDNVVVAPHAGDRQPARRLEGPRIEVVRRDPHARVGRASPPNLVAESR